MARITRMTTIMAIRTNIRRPRWSKRSPISRCWKSRCESSRSKRGFSPPRIIGGSRNGPNRSDRPVVHGSSPKPGAIRHSSSACSMTQSLLAGNRHRLARAHGCRHAQRLHEPAGAGRYPRLASRHRLHACSCYPRPLLGHSPYWYRSPNYRRRLVRWPRQVLTEFGLSLPPETEIRVEDFEPEMPLHGDAHAARGH